MKVATSYDRSNGFAPIPNMEGRDFKSFEAAGQALQDGQCVTLEIKNKGYKTVEKRDGGVYVQRNFAHEY